MLNPMCFEAHNNLGVIVKDQGNLARSIQHYQAALAVNPVRSEFGMAWFSI